MTPPDTEETNAALLAFQAAWKSAARDYADRLINSEHCLQAALYRGLRKRLSKDFSIYVEAPVFLGKSAKESTEKKRVVVDLLVCHGARERRKIVAAIELKFTPRGAPRADSIRTDVARLSYVTRRRGEDNHAKIEMPRFRKRDEGALALKVLSQRKVIFGVFCADTRADALKADFWREHTPREGHWVGRRMPKQLVIAIAATSDDGKAKAYFSGKPVERLAAG